MEGQPGQKLKTQLGSRFGLDTFLILSPVVIIVKKLTVMFLKVDRRPVYIMICIDVFLSS